MRDCSEGECPPKGNKLHNEEGHDDVSEFKIQGAFRVRPRDVDDGLGAIVVEHEGEDKQKDLFESDEFASGGDRSIET